MMFKQFSYDQFAPILTLIPVDNGEFYRFFAPNSTFEGNL